jgi:hypothetical protein
LKIGTFFRPINRGGRIIRREYRRKFYAENFYDNGPFSNIGTFGDIFTFGDMVKNKILLRRLKTGRRSK